MVGLRISLFSLMKPDIYIFFFLKTVGFETEWSFDNAGDGGVGVDWVFKDDVSV